jgi:predicted XRE-type DNA-binding protein
MGVKRKNPPTEEEKAPPLPDEPLPVIEEQPPLPDELPPPLPEEDVPVDQPPLPDEPPPPTSEEPIEISTPAITTDVKGESTGQESDGWQAIWEPSANAYYFYNTETQESTWLNPRLPPDEAAAALAANPPIIDPNAPPAVYKEPVPEDVYNPETGEYGFTARFNSRTGKFQNDPEHTAENFSTQGQLMRTAREYFDVSQMSQGRIIGKSGGALKSERRTMKIPKAQLKELIKRKREKKDKNKREWLLNDDIIVRKH